MREDKMREDKKKASWLTTIGVTVGILVGIATLLGFLKVPFALITRAVTDGWFLRLSGWYLLANAFSLPFGKIPGPWQRRKPERIAWVAISITLSMVASIWAYGYYHSSQLDTTFVLGVPFNVYMSIAVGIEIPMFMMVAVRSVCYSHRTRGVRVAFADLLWGSWRNALEDSNSQEEDEQRSE